MRTQTEKNWAVALHLSPFAGALIPLAGIIAPLAIWFTKRKESKYLDLQGKEVMNLLICESIASMVLIVLAMCIPLLRSLGGGSDFLSTFMLPVAFVLMLAPLAALGIVLPVLAAVKCSNGDDFRYPFIVRLVK